MELGIVITILLTIIFTDFRTVIKKRNKKITILYSIILLLAFTAMFLNSFDIKIPSPSMIIYDLINSITKGK
jgi:hypothetical protein